MGMTKKTFMVKSEVDTFLTKTVNEAKLKARQEVEKYAKEMNKFNNDINESIDASNDSMVRKRRLMVNLSMSPI